MTTKLYCLLVCAGLVVTTACGGDDEDSNNNAENDALFNNAATGAAAAGGANGGAANGASANGGSSGGSASGASGVTSDPSTCAEGDVHASRVTPRVTLVLDGSCSMATPYPANGAQSASRCDDVPNSRWSALRDALLGPNGVVTRLAPIVEFGLVTFGTLPDCPLTADPIVPSLDNLNAIDNAVPRTPPGLYTPTGPALDYVYNNLIDPPSLDVDRGTQVVVLATDGEPNSCDDSDPNYQPSLDASLLGQQVGATTYVISLADATGEFHEHLQQLANLGAGLPATGGQDAQLYEPANPDQLAATLEMLIGDAIGCDIELNGIITDGAACMGTVELNGEPLGCEDPNGWTMIDSRHIRLQGAACDAFKMSPSALVRADFDCSVFRPD